MEYSSSLGETTAGQVRDAQGGDHADPRGNQLVQLAERGPGRAPNCASEHYFDRSDICFSIA